MWLPKHALPLLPRRYSDTEYAVSLFVSCKQPLHSLTLAHVVLKFLADQYDQANADFPSLIAASFAYHRDGVSALLLFDSELESAYRRAHDDSFSIHSANISFRGFPVSFSHPSGLTLFNRPALRRAFLFAWYAIAYASLTIHPCAWNHD